MIWLVFDHVKQTCKLVKEKKKSFDYLCITKLAKDVHYNVSLCRILYPGRAATNADIMPVGRKTSPCKSAKQSCAYMPRISVLDRINSQ